MYYSSQLHPWLLLFLLSVGRRVLARSAISTLPVGTPVLDLSWVSALVVLQYILFVLTFERLTCRSSTPVAYVIPP